MLSKKEYQELRETYRVLGNEALAKDDIREAEYMSGVIRGLDLAFNDGSAKEIKK